MLLYISDMRWKKSVSFYVPGIRSTFERYPDRSTYQRFFYRAWKFPDVQSWTLKKPTNLRIRGFSFTDTGTLKISEGIFSARLPRAALWLYKYKYISDESILDLFIHYPEYPFLFFFYEGGGEGGEVYPGQTGFPGSSNRGLNFIRHMSGDPRMWRETNSLVYIDTLGWVKSLIWRGKDESGRTGRFSYRLTTYLELTSASRTREMRKN